MEADSNDADGATTSSAGGLEERLAEIHRRTEELAGRVASFRSDTGPEPEQDAEPKPDAEPKQEPAPESEGEYEPEPERRHRPRPSAAAPLIYDEDLAEADQGADDKADEKSADKADDKADERTAEKPDEQASDKPAENTEAAPQSAKQASTEEKKPDKKASRGLPSWVRRLRTFVIVIVIALAAAWALRTYVVAPYYVPSASMEPTLHGCSNCNDDHVLVQKLSYDFHDPQRGDIVVFNNPGKRPGCPQRRQCWSQAKDQVLIKRVIGVAGDKLQIRNRKVYINGQLLDEPYVNKSCHGTSPNGTRSYKVPKGDLFVMGDNRCDSEDSRVFGPVPIDKVIGKAFLIFWPLGRFGSL